MCFPNTKFFRFVRQEFVSVMNRNYLEAALLPRWGLRRGVAGLGVLTWWVVGRQQTALCPGVQTEVLRDAILT